MTRSSHRRLPEEQRERPEPRDLFEAKGPYNEFRPTIVRVASSTAPMQASAMPGTASHKSWSCRRPSTGTTRHTCHWPAWSRCDPVRDLVVESSVVDRRAAGVAVVARARRGSGASTWTRGTHGTAGKAERLCRKMPVAHVPGELQHVPTAKAAMRLRLRRTDERPASCCRHLCKEEEDGDA